MILTYDKNWDITSSTEHHAYRMAECYLPETDNAIYIAFPWADLFQFADDSANYKKLFTHIEKLKNSLSHLQDKKIVTVFQGKCFSQYIAIFRELGITDIFWCYSKIGKNQLDGTDIRLWPFPSFTLNSSKLLDWDKRQYLLASTKSYSSAALSNFHNCSNIALNEAKFFLLAGNNSAPIWECIQNETIPIVTDSTFLPAGNRALWQNAVVFCEGSDVAAQNLTFGLELLANNKNEVSNKLKAIRQLKFLYGKEYFVFDLVKFFVSPENMIHERKSYHTFFSLDQAIITESYSPIEDSNLFVLSFISKMLTSKGKYKNKLKDVYFSAKLKSAIAKADKKNSATFKKIMLLYKVELV